MIELDVHLCPTMQAQRPLAAVLLPGADPSQWLLTLSQHGLALEVIKFLPLGDPHHAAAAAGVLCVLPAGQGDNIDRRYPQYGCLIGRLFVPVEATFDPPLTDADWHELLPADDSLLVWHPQFGLVRFEPPQQLRVQDLCLPALRREVDWSFAQAGSVLNRRLTSLQAIFPSDDVEEMLQGGQDDIGSRNDKLGKLPKGPSEQAQFDWKSIAVMPLLPFSMAAGWLANQIPASEQGSRFMAKVADLLNRVGSLPARLLQEREREIHRLLDKLKHDPDDGLKYALPISDVLGRGIAAPGSRLGQREVDFRLGSSGGGPADHWTLNALLQTQLTQSYYAAAVRELRLGRFRRAAYIYASLLGNHLAAANALEQGRFYHEASAVYRGKLARPADAARCLELGGLLQEAIEIYRDTKQHLKVGELYERLECLDEARAAYQQAVDELLERQDRLGAAILVEKRLHDPDAAMSLLEAGWPSSPQANQCLERFFATTSSLGLSERAEAKLKEVCQTPISHHQRLNLVTTLAQVARTHVSVPIAERAADATRVQAAKVLSQSPHSQTVLRAVADLARDDLLLDRDCRRFQGAPPKVQQASAIPLQMPTKKYAGGQRNGTITLPDGCQWLHGITHGEHFYLAGHDLHQKLTLVRGRWDVIDPALESVSWTGPGVGSGHPLVVLAFSPNQVEHIHISQLGRPPIPSRLFRRTDTCPPVLAESPAWLDKSTAAIARNSQYSYTCDLNGQFRQFDTRGLPQATHHLGEPDDDAVDFLHPPVLHARERDVYVGYGTMLYRLDETGQMQRLQLPSRITGISGSRMHTLARIVVTHETGAFILLPTTHAFGETMIEENRPNLLGVVLRDGRAVLYSSQDDRSGELLVYSAAKDRVQFQVSTARRLDSTSAPSGIRLLLPTTTPNQVALIPSGPQSPIELWSFPTPERG